MVSFNIVTPTNKLMNANDFPMALAQEDPILYREGNRTRCLKIVHMTI